MKRSHIYLGMFFSAVLGAVIASLIITSGLPQISQASYNSIADRQQQVSYRSVTDTALTITPIDFESAAGMVIPGVVHIRTLYSSVATV